MLRPFRLHEPGSVEEAARLLGDLGEDGKVYAGGTELLLVMKEGLLRYGNLVNIKPLGLNQITYDPADDSLHIGATVTHRAVELSPVVAEHCPLLVEMEERLANVRVRVAGTLGGNLCFAEPHADPGTVLMLYDAVLVVKGRGGERRIPIQEFFVDAYATCLEEDEILTEIIVPKLPRGAGASYMKFGFLERPSVGVGSVLIAAADGRTVAEARIAVGCVGPKPVRMTEAEELLVGAPLTDPQFEEALEKASARASELADAVDDLHGSAEYKKHLVGVFVRRSMRQARERLGKEGR